MILSPDEKGEQSVSNIILISVQRVNENLFLKKSGLCSSIFEFREQSARCFHISMLLNILAEEINWSFQWPSLVFFNKKKISYGCFLINYGEPQNKHMSKLKCFPNLIYHTI